MEIQPFPEKYSIGFTYKAKKITTIAAIVLYN